MVKTSRGDTSYRLLVMLKSLHNTKAENLLYVMGIMYPVVHQAAWHRALSKVVLSTKFQDSHLWHKNVPPGYRALLHCYHYGQYSTQDHQLVCSPVMTQTREEDMETSPLQQGRSHSYFFQMGMIVFI